MFIIYYLIVLTDLIFDIGIIDKMSDAKVNSEDTEMVFQRLRALPGNKVNIFKIVFVNNW